MATEIEVQAAVSLLESDVLKHIFALKMIGLYGPGVGLDLRRAGSDWALAVRMPDGLALWDRRNYGTVPVVILDGDAPGPQLELLETISERPVVVKTAVNEVRRELERQGAELRLSFLNFTLPAAAARPATPGAEFCVELSEEAARLFACNGYERTELEDFFRRGAVWFGVKEGGRLVSACFVYQNYKSVWEIASVWTEPEHRGRGLGKTVVASALEFLAGQGLTPRYNLRRDNRASIAVARACGLVEFLKFDHYLWQRSG